MWIRKKIQEAQAEGPQPHPSIAYDRKVVLKNADRLMNVKKHFLAISSAKFHFNFVVVVVTVAFILFAPR